MSTTEIGRDSCDRCGSLLHHDTGEPVDPLVAACDVLVMRAMEVLGKRIVRYERSRFDQLGNRPYRLAHTLWQTPESVVDKVLEDSWDALPAILDDHGCCGATPDQVAQVLDRYVHDLVDAGTGHDLRELRWRLAIYLGMPVQ